MGVILRKNPGQPSDFGHTSPDRVRYDQFNLPEFLLKLHSDTTSALNTVTSYGPGFVEINKIRFDHAIAFGPHGEIARWSARDPSDISSDLLFSAARLTLAPADPMAFLDSDDTRPTVVGERPEVLLVGTGERHVMLGRDVLDPLLRVGIGVECMSTGAAARTYNVLMAEGRLVIAALIP